MELHKHIQKMLAAIQDERVAVQKALGGLEGLVELEVLEGRRTTHEPGAHGYAFPCDLEILLPEGTQFQLRGRGYSSPGEVVEHDLATGRLQVLLRDDVGEELDQATLTFDSSSLLVALAACIEALGQTAPGKPPEDGADPDPHAQQTAAEHALKFLMGDADPKPPAEFMSDRLDRSQQRAVAFLLNQDFGYLWGPPGTGKTRTVACLVHEACARGMKVLLCAHTNVATDTALLRTIQVGSWPECAVLRVGAQSEDIQKQGVGLYQVTDRLLVRERPELVDRLERLLAVLGEARPVSPTILNRENVSFIRRLRALQESLDEIEPEDRLLLAQECAELFQLWEGFAHAALESAALVATTLTQLTTNRLLQGLRFDTVVIDEASIASLAHTFVAASHACKQVIAAGDFMQLPPIVKAQTPVAKTWLGKHVFHSAGCDRVEAGHPLRVMLDEQWRMHPKISRVVSQLFYHDKLKDAPGLSSNPLASGQIEVFTIHKFQGRDKPLVILDLVDAPGTACGFLSEHSNPVVANLLNVAISRAKQKLIIVAHQEHLAQVLGHTALVCRLLAAYRLAEACQAEAGRPGDLPVIRAFLG